MQIRYNAEADRRTLEAGLPLLNANPGSEALLAKVRERLAQLNSPSSETEIGFVSQNSPHRNANSPNPSPRAATNRRNAQHSTGSRSPLGKMASSRNSGPRAQGADAHGQPAEQLASCSGGSLDSKPVLRVFPGSGLASGQPIIPGEDPAAFDDLLSALQEEHQPAAPTEELLVKGLAQSYWLTQRAIRFQNECFSADGVNEKQLALFLRYQTTHERAFYKSLNTLIRLQKDRARANRGFVSHAAPQPVQTIPQTPVTSGFVSQGAPQSALEHESRAENDLLPNTKAAA